MVEHRAFKAVDRLKRKFRSFLLASFQNHLSDAADRNRRLKRGGDKVSYTWMRKPPKNAIGSSWSTF
jgi:hypothetical protein